MKVGDKIDVRGYVTKEKYIAGRNLQTLEQILGFHSGRFADGIWLIRLERLPALNEFEGMGYSMTAQHRFQRPSNLDLEKIKRMARDSWRLNGGDCLVKVRPNMVHDDSLDPDFQYPPGLGAPQWRLTAPIPGTVIAEVRKYPAAVFRPC